MKRLLPFLIGFALAPLPLLRAQDSAPATVVRDGVPAAATVELDIAYTEVASSQDSPGGAAAVDTAASSNSANDEQKLDLYLPAGRDFTTIVFTWGGGWHAGGRKSVTPIGEKLQALGFGCALLSHRLGPKELFPAQIEDVAGGFAWVKKNIAARGGDAARVFVMGHSSGAHLSLLLASDPRYLAKHALTPDDIAGVIGLSAPVDLRPRKSGIGFGDALLGGRGADTFNRDVELMTAASPIEHVNDQLPRTLLITGENDFPMLANDAEAFADKADHEGVTVKTFLAKKLDHMGVVQALLVDDCEVRAQVLEFLREPSK